MTIELVFKPLHGVPAPYEAGVPEEMDLRPFLNGKHEFVVVDSDGNEGDPYVPSNYDDLLGWIEGELASFHYEEHGPWEASLRIYDEQDELVGDYLIEVYPLDVTTSIRIDEEGIKRQGVVEWRPAEWFGVGFLRGENIEEGYEIFLEEDRFSGFFEFGSRRVSLQKAAEMAARELARRSREGEHFQPEIVFFHRLDLPGHHKPVGIASRIRLEIEHEKELD